MRVLAISRRKYHAREIWGDQSKGAKANVKGSVHAMSMMRTGCSFLLPLANQGRKLRGARLGLGTLWFLLFLLAESRGHVQQFAGTNLRCRVCVFVVFFIVPILHGRCHAITDGKEANGKENDRHRSSE